MYNLKEMKDSIIEGKRIGRLQYFYFSLYIAMFYAGSALLADLFFHTLFVSVFARKVWLITCILISMRLGQCRARDLNISGHYYLFLLIIPLVQYVFTLFLVWRKGTVGDNRYGADPLISHAL